MRDTTMRDGALARAAELWAVLPCLPTGAKAKSPLTEHGHLDATRDPELIERWWRRWPPAMIGGRVPDHLAVIDIDPHAGGSIEALAAAVGPLPPTLTVRSGRGDGGRHLYFTRPPATLSVVRLCKVAPGIDLKANGYTILPPSLHPATGQPYTFGEHHAPVPMPVRLVDLLRPPPVFRNGRVSQHKSTGHALVDFVAGQREGNRNKALFWAACRAAEEGSLDAIEDALKAAADSIGLAKTPVENTIASARERGVS